MAGMGRKSRSRISEAANVAPVTAIATSFWARTARRGTKPSRSAPRSGIRTRTVRRSRLTSEPQQVREKRARPAQDEQRIGAHQAGLDRADGAGRGVDRPPAPVDEAVDQG